MAFIKKLWADGVGGNTPVTAAELNRIETGIDETTRRAAFMNIDANNDFGVVANGTTDDTAAMQAALNAVGAAGGVVRFRGPVAISAPLQIKSYTTLISDHVPRYMYAGDVDQGRILALPSFSGTGMIKPLASQRGIRLSGLLLDGMQVTGGIHGVDNPIGVGEFGWVLDNLQILGFTGSGWHGSMHVMMATNVHINNNFGYGILVDGAHKFVDMFWSNAFLYFNRSGGVNFDSTGPMGLVEFANMRIERSGNNHLNIAAPHNGNAPGIRLRKLANSNFTNVGTDANTGSGLDIDLPAGTSGQVVDLNFSNCIWKRDGGGDGVTNPQRAGVLVKGTTNSSPDAAQYINFSNCSVITGRLADDGTSPAYEHPSYGLHVEYAYYINWIGCKTRGIISNYNFGVGGDGSLFRCCIIDRENSLFTIPREDTADRPVNGLMRGMVMVDAALDKIIFRDSNGTWKDATGVVV